VQGLPVSHYLDPARAPLEAVAVFAASWQFVCHVSDLPAVGTAVRFDCAGRSAIVLRTRAGSLQAYRNACRHRGARLVEGDSHTGLAFCVDGRLRCPYHGWTYDDAGALVSIPVGQRFDAGFDPAQHALLPAHVTQWRGLVFVAFELPRESLAAVLDVVAQTWPDLAALRRVIEPRTMDCAADWKLAAEHLLDAGHLDVARPGLKPRVFDAPVFAPDAGAALAARGSLALDDAGATWSARACRRLLQNLTLEPVEARSLFLWPNTWLQLAPDGLVVLQVLPQAGASCTYRELRYAQPDSTREMRLARYLHHRVRRQALAADVRLLRRVQQGMTNLDGVEPGPIAASEPGLRWFVSRYLERVAPELIAARPVVARRRNRARALPTTQA
jgi:phenylpropionate dioxygenase-like ring-hydroxylating dioxygenase large terminal subunit